MPRRIVTILEGESLLNDATALTIYSIAARGRGRRRVLAGRGRSSTFAGAMLGGCAIGLAVGWVIAQIRSRIEDTPVEITISLLTPYAAFLPAERLGASGVIATVVAGLYLGHRGSRIMGADARLTGRAVWETITFLLNGFVFIVMGLEVPLLLRALTPVGGDPARRHRRRGDRRPGRSSGRCGSSPPCSCRSACDGAGRTPHLLAHSLVLSWAGMRGVVSLAAALALPLAAARPAGRSPRAKRSSIVTLTVIVLTLLGQGLTLPWLIRIASTRRRRRGSAKRRARARQQLVEAATRRIDQLYAVWPGHRPLLDRLRDTYRDRSEHVERQRDPSTDGEDRELIEHREIRRTIIDSEREALLRLRAEGEIDDDVLREPRARARPRRAAHGRRDPQAEMQQLQRDGLQPCAVSGLQLGGSGDMRVADGSRGRRDLVSNDDRTIDTDEGETPCRQP